MRPPPERESSVSSLVPAFNPIDRIIDKGNDDHESPINKRNCNNGDLKQITGKLPGSLDY